MELGELGGRGGGGNFTKTFLLLYFAFHTFLVSYLIFNHFFTFFLFFRENPQESRGVNAVNKNFSEPGLNSKISN